MATHLTSHVASNFHNNTQTQSRLKPSRTWRNGRRPSFIGLNGLGGLPKCCRSANGLCPRLNAPFFVPAVQPIELFFFQRVFDHLYKQRVAARLPSTKEDSKEECPILSQKGDIFSTFSLGDEAQKQRQSIDEAQNHPTPLSNGSEPRSELHREVQEHREVPLVQFHRAMVRLFRVLNQPQPDVKVKSFDANMNGKVGWYEFCSFWKENQIAVRLSWAERLFLTLEDAERSLMGRIMSILVFIAIIVSTTCFVLGTIPDWQSKCILEGEPGYDPDCKPEADDVFKDIDLACVIFFSIEYGLRLILSGVMRSELVDRDKQRLLHWMVSDDTIRMPSILQRVSAFFFHPANLIDLAAIMPWFLSQIFSGNDDSFFIRLIRLTRVIRAFRLGKRFEAVIIIARSIRRSVRALYVLVLNLMLGVIIFASLMHFAEQGTWDSEKKSYLRYESSEWNEVTKNWDDVKGRSPFESIPSSFWWAVVTATTVGYGDIYPTTWGGKAIAMISMLWSLCVLALPIGVIGNNFSQVWVEYDAEKAREEWDRIKEEMMLKRSIAWGDPLHYSRRILLEVWHDPGLSDDDQALLQAEFMGEVDFTLDLPNQEISQRLTLPLTANYEKARRRVRGELTFQYSWQPADKCSDGALLCGKLEVVVLCAEDLISIDWKGSCCSDPYVIIIAYPQSPKDGRVEPKWYRTETAPDTSFPRWDSQVTFDFNWTEAGSAQCVAADMRDLGCHGVGDPNSQSSYAKTPRKSIAVNGIMERRRSRSGDPMVPELQAELRQLKETVVPQLQGDMREIREDLQRIIEALRKNQSSQESTDLERTDEKTRQEELSTSSTNPPAGLSSADA